MNILVTGSCGFIGYHFCEKILKYNKHKIIGIDNLNKYYDVRLKKDRLLNLQKNKKFIFHKIDINNEKKLKTIFKKHKINIVVHFAAQAGVRHSITNPKSYFDNNILGFFKMLEYSREFKIKHLIFASTSSVYGDQRKFPVSEFFNTDKPQSFYAASKKTNEVMAYAYANIYKLPITCLRFFTVYGPYGRPDMALHIFTKAALQSKNIDLYNRGDHIRDWTYIDDVVLPIIKLINKPPKEKIPYICFNLGSDRPKKLTYFIKNIEKTLNLKIKTKLFPLQKGDVRKTHANMKLLSKYIKYKSTVKMEEGIVKFVSWFKNYYRSK